MRAAIRYDAAGVRHARVDFLESEAWMPANGLDYSETRGDFAVYTTPCWLERHYFHPEDLGVDK